MTERRTFIVVVNFNSTDHVRSLLESLASEAFDQLIIVDNSDAPLESADLRQLVQNRPHVRTISPGTNLGFGAAINLAVREINPRDEDFIWFLNPDIRVYPGASAALRTAIVDRNLGCASPVIVTGDYNDSTVWFAGGHYNAARGQLTHESFGTKHVKSETVTLTTFITGAAPMYTGRTLRHTGPFAERFFLYWEDFEYSNRVNNCGIVQGVVHEAVVWHAENGSSKDRRTHGKSHVFYYYVMRNRLLLQATRRQRVQLLAGRGVGETLRYALQAMKSGGQRRSKMLALLTGARDGLRGLDGPRPSRRGPRETSAQYFDSARTAHLERLPQGCELWYRKRSYDFALNAERANVRQMGWGMAAYHVWSRKIDKLELNEPLMITAWPSLLPLVLCARLLRPSCSIRFYAIENHDPAATLASKTGLPTSVTRRLVRTVVNLLMRRVDRVAFGTKAARELYASYGVSDGGRRSASQIREFSPLPHREERLVVRSRERGANHQVLFVGSLEPRKGIPELMAAWRELKLLDESIELVIAGKGPQLAEVSNWVSAQRDVTLIVDPPRSRIRELFAEADVVALLSKPTDRWSEQIGLPLLEGWAAGCELVSTVGTGISPILIANGHRIVPSTEPAVVARVIYEAVSNRRSREEIQAQLPERDGRLQAAEWLHSA